MTEEERLKKIEEDFFREEELKGVPEYAHWYTLNPELMKKVFQEAVEIYNRDGIIDTKNYKSKYWDEIQEEINRCEIDLPSKEIASPNIYIVNGSVPMHDDYSLIEGYNLSDISTITYIGHIEEDKYIGKIPHRDAIHLIQKDKDYIRMSYNKTFKLDISQDHGFIAFGTLVYLGLDFKAPKEKDEII